MQYHNFRHSSELNRSNSWHARLVTLLTAIFLTGILAAQSEPIQAEERINLNSEARYLLDSWNTDTPEDILLRGDWRENRGDSALNLGFTRKTVWVDARVNLPPISNASGAWMLSIPYPLLENVKVYAVQDSETGTLIQSIDKSQNPTTNHVFPLPESLLNKDLRLIIRAESSTALQVPLEIWSTRFFHSREVQETLYWGLFFGLIGGLLIYNLFVFYSVREVAYGFYALYLSSILGVMLSISGFGRVYLWSEMTAWNAVALPVFTILSSSGGLLFARYFLAWEGRKVPLSKILLTLTGICLAALPLILVSPTQGTEIAAALSSVACLLVIASAALAWHQGIAIARYFTLAWLFLAVGASLYLQNVFGLLPVTQWTTWSLQTGSALEALLLSLALAHRIKLERHQKLEAMQQHHRAERKVREMKLRIMENAMHERVTGLPNDSLLLTRMRELAGYEIGRPRDFYLVMLQFPQLRDIATTLGRDLCDDLFRNLARDISLRMARHPDSICVETSRDAFLAVTDVGNVALLFNGNLTEAEVSMRLRQTLEPYEKSISLGAVSLAMDAFAGIAHFPRQAGDVEQLYQRALQARDAGYSLNRRQNFYNSDMDHAMRRRLALQGALTLAINRGELELYLQPQMKCEDMHLEGAEILLRWNSPDHGPVPTQEFIEIAESAGLMDKLTQYVITRALALLKDLHSLGIQLKLSINLSIQNLMEPDFADFVIRTARLQDVELRNLVLEITETAMTRNMDSVIKNLETLAGDGAHIALDDFGTGYSSLKYLSRLPIHELKIDKSFILKMAANESDFRIVENTIKLAKALKLETVAEGVEDQTALQTVTRLGCHRVQGYHTGRPMSINHFKSWALKSSA